jgi:glycerol-3-phosphate acyltransferase PlsY
LLGIPGGEVLVLTVAMVLAAGLIAWRHRSNIARLRAGTEEKVTWIGR